MTETIGIDLGTTFSAAARIDATGNPVMIPNAEGEMITPSVIYFGSAPPIVGRDAKREQRSGSPEIASFFKRNMGNPHFSLTFGDRSYSPIDLSVLVLQKIKRDCEEALRSSVSEAVITVPAYFNDAQRKATIEAGKLAGLNVRHIINEPTAAALAYGVHKTGREEITLVYDLGGGTFDITLVKISPTDIAVLGTAGDHELGGKDWDDRIVRFAALRFREEHGADPLKSLESFNDLLVRAEEAKQKLSSLSAVKLLVDHGGLRGAYDLTREEFESMTADLMERTQQLTEQVLSDAQLSWARVTGVLLVGGSTRMPMVRQYVERMSGKPPRTGIEVDHAVAMGAAIQAAIDLQASQPSARKLRIAGEKRIQDAMSHSLGMVAISPDRSRYINTILIEKNKPIPATSELPYKLRTRPGTDNICEVYLTQGESGRPNDCSYLGKYVFSGIAHDKSREVILNVRYMYDLNGMVQVAATDSRTGQMLPMLVEPIPADMSWVDRPPVEQQWAPEPVTIFLVIDVSYSMEGGSLAEAQKAATAFRQKCDLAHMALGLVSFGSSAQVVVDACQDARRIDKAIRKLSVDGTTNMAAGLEEAHDRLRGTEGKKFLVLLTDGIPDDAGAAEMRASECKADDIELVAIGTSGADVHFLAGLSTSEEHAVFAEAGSLVGQFSTIAQAITEHASGDGQLRIKRR